MNPNSVENKGVSELKRLCGKYGLSPWDLSVHLGVVPVRIYEIMNGKRRITIDSDLRLCRFFELEEGYFFALQSEYDAVIEKEKLGKALAKIPRIGEVALKKK